MWFFLLNGATEKRREEVERLLDDAVSEWRQVTHPSWATATPLGREPAWWDEEQAGREALAYMGRAGQRELARLTGADPAAK